MELSIRVNIAGVCIFKMNNEEEMYEVGHNTLTYIIDKDGKKRLIYTGDDWSTADFMEDLAHLLHHDTSADVDGDGDGEHGH